MLGARFVRDMGVDLGTANTLVYVSGEGIVVREPSVIARTADGRILAVGAEAKRMIGRTPADIIAVRPLREGVIAHFETTTALLAHFMRQAAPVRPWLGPRVVIGVPSGATDVERRALVEATLKAGAREAYLVEEPIAAAVGAGLPVEEPGASTIADIGGGRTQVAVISLGGIVVSRSARVAGDEMDQAIIQYVRRAYNMVIGERTAEAVKIALGSAHPLSDGDRTAEVRGQHVVSGLPRIIRLTAAELRQALAEPLQAIVDTVKQTLEQTPPELSADLVQRGIVLTGGGSLLPGLRRLLADETGIPVRRSDDPLSDVALGAGRALEHLRARRVALAPSGSA
ncbi:MAG: rod shape-determining protein [Armatimonadota bacterium]|nr:rod shape-determining protein [Armatimonadota bacterium]MDR7448228.1 rod shape-determining protein [Armatimonadota bacterium]MDR7458841.1 rod shape-determining protein [Armatimonadota bacterium]MDR7479127.1 rod shape-determining protein [Armatimonadota bacterium]MDR7487661.1 rod shape-determining protein [Armatimonadota bacterium]